MYETPTGRRLNSENLFVSIASKLISVRKLGKIKLKKWVKDVYVLYCKRVYNVYKNGRGLRPAVDCDWYWWFKEILYKNL